MLRTERGLTYGAQANMDTLKESGDFEAETNTRSDATGEVLRLIVDEFWRLQRERVGERELADAKAYLTGSFPLTIETPDAIAMQVLNVAVLRPAARAAADLPRARERRHASTTSSASRGAAATRSAVGRARRQRGGVRVAAAGVGFGTFETVELGDLDLTSANFKRATVRAQAGGRRAGGRGQAGRVGRAVRPAVAQACRPATISRRRSRAGRRTSRRRRDARRPTALLDQAIAAKGGLEKLRG